MMWFFWFPLLAVPFLLMWAFRHGTGVGCCGMPHADGHVQVPNGQADPVEIVRQRLARGEITPEQYEEIRRALG
jgi:uncharacterized membrane protein